MANRLHPWSGACCAPFLSEPSTTSPRLALRSILLSELRRYVGPIDLADERVRGRSFVAPRFVCGQASRIYDDAQHAWGAWAISPCDEALRTTSLLPSRSFGAAFRAHAQRNGLPSGIPVGCVCGMGGCELGCSLPDGVACLLTANSKYEIDWLWPTCG